MSQWGTPEQRFWKHVDASGGLDACWPWIGGRDDKGYGQLAYDGIRSKGAHRLALRLAGTEIPPGMSVLHSCDNPPCVNPAHLRVGTASDNLRDMFSRDRQPPHLRPWTHCKRGHAIEGENTRSNGSRIVCRTCRRNSQRVSQRLRRARLRARSGDEPAARPSAPHGAGVRSDSSPDVRRRTLASPGD